LKGETEINKSGQQAMGMTRKEAEERERAEAGCKDWAARPPDDG